jgi:tetratricopeptide (TPR) repeat protein
MYEKAQNYRNEIDAFLVVGNCFLLDNKIDSAFYYFNESLILADYQKIPREQSNSRHSIGVAYREAKVYREAKKMFFEALSFPVDSIEQTRLYLNLAKTYNLENQIDSAKFYLNHSLNFKTQELNLLLSTYSLLSKIEEKLGHYNESLQYFKKYNTYVAKVADESKDKVLLELQKKYDFETIKNERNSLLIEKQQLTIISIIVLFISSFIGFLFYRKSVRKDKFIFEGLQTMESLKEMLRSYSENENSVRNIFLHHFNILKKVALIEKDITEVDREKGKPMIKKIKKIVYEQDALDWDKLYQIINKIHNGRLDQVREHYPQLSSDEFRICYLSCGDFNDTEIYTILGKPWTLCKVQKTRSNIRKKIGVAPHGNIYEFFIENLL